nr:hypothetical protein [Tanacetum cinerariifolium]
MKNSFIEGLLFEIQQQNVRQDGGASEAIQELRDAIDDARSSAIIRVADIVRRVFKRAFEQAASEIGWELDHTGWNLCRRQWTGTIEQLIEQLESTYDNAPNMFSIRTHHGGKFKRYPGRMYVSGRVDIFDMVDIDLFTVVALNMMVLKLGYTGKSEPIFYNYLKPLTSLDEGLYALAWEEDVRCMGTLKPVCESVIPSSLPQHDSNTSFKDSVCESITRRCMPDFILTPPTDESVITYTQLSGVQGVDTHSHILSTIQTQFSDINLSFVSHQATASHVIDDVMRQLSFDETELDGEAGFADVVEGGVDSSGLSHDESFGVDDMDLNLNEPVPIEEEVGTQEFSVEDVVVEDYVSSGDDVKHEHDVDAYLFGISMDLPFENIGITNLVSDDVLGKDVDVINEDGFDSDLGNDEEKNNRKRRLAKLRTEMEGVINASVERNTVPFLPTRVFQRIYICLRVLKLGIRACKRDQLGLDGAFIKGSFPGQVLVAVRLDSNNGVYPLAYELAEAESRAKSDLLLNNIYEVFNGKIVRGRDKPVIILLKHIREYCMMRIVNVQGYEEKKFGVGGNNIKASGSASGQVQQTEHAVGQDGSGGSGACAVIVIDNRKFMMVDEEDLIFKKILPMAEEILEMLRVCIAKRK